MELIITIVSGITTILAVFLSQMQQFHGLHKTIDNIEHKQDKLNDKLDNHIKHHVEVHRVRIRK